MTDDPIHQRLNDSTPEPTSDNSADAVLATPSRVRTVPVPEGSTNTPGRPPVSHTDRQHKEGDYPARVDRSMVLHWWSLSLSEFQSCYWPRGRKLDDAEVARLETMLVEELCRKSNDGQKLQFKPTNETGMHAPLCRVFRELLKGTGYVVMDVGNRAETKHADHKSDLAMLPAETSDGTEHPARLAWELSQEEVDARKVSPERKEFLAQIAWSWLICPIELKYSTKHDPFGGGVTQNIPIGGIEPLLPEEQEAQRARGQLIRYATETFVRQHREFVYTPIIMGTKARFVRWDRCGAIVSEAFDYVENPGPLLDFFYRLVTAPPRAQGYDTSVTLATQPQIEELQEYYRGLKTSAADSALDYERKFMLKMMEDTVKYPLRQLKIPVTRFKPPRLGTLAETADTDHLTLIIGHRHVASFSPIGRGTVGFIAYIVGMRRLVFLKDTWRADSPDIPAELSIYKSLYELGVENIPEMVGGGDVEHEETADCDTSLQYTETQRHLAARTEGILRRIHYRLVTETLGIPLEDYHNSYALIHVIRDALKAHRGAWAGGQGILHRDISSGNIMIDIRSKDIMNFPRGFLTDWDTSRQATPGLAQAARQHARSGTWAFMSGPILKYPTKPQEVSDDLESFIHLIDFFALRYHRHKLTQKSSNKLHQMLDNSLTEQVATFFYSESVREVDNRLYYLGGRGKYSIYLSDEEPCALSQDSLFKTLLRHLHTLCREHYRSSKVRALADQYPQFTIVSEDGEQEQAPPMELLGGGSEGDEDDVSSDLDAEPSRPIEETVRPDPLDDHERLYKYIDSALRKRRKWMKTDKTGDQFANLAMPGWHSHRGLSTCEAPSKRSIADDGGDASGERGPRKRARTRATTTSEDQATGP